MIPGERRVLLQETEEVGVGDDAVLDDLGHARIFHEAVGLTGLIVTKLDGTARGGALVAVVRELGVPVRFIGVGEQPADLQPFDARAYARSIVGLAE